MTDVEKTLNLIIDVVKNEVIYKDAVATIKGIIKLYEKLNISNAGNHDLPSEYFMARTAAAIEALTCPFVHNCENCDFGRLDESGDYSSFWTCDEDKLMAEAADLLKTFYDYFKE